MNVPLAVTQLTAKTFAPYGTFGSLTDPQIPPLVNEDRVRYFPDVGGYLSAPLSMIGACIAEWRPLNIIVSEFHLNAMEGILPITGDIYFPVARPTLPGCQPDGFEVFLVPQGTQLILKPAVWHHAPYSAVEGQPVATQILLPRSTYATDCVRWESPFTIPFKP